MQGSARVEGGWCFLQTQFCRLSKTGIVCTALQKSQKTPTPPPDYINLTIMYRISIILQTVSFTQSYPLYLVRSPQSLEWPAPNIKPAKLKSFSLPQDRLLLTSLLNMLLSVAIRFCGVSYSTTFPFSRPRIISLSTMVLTR